MWPMLQAKLNNVARQDTTLKEERKGKMTLLRALHGKKKIEERSHSSKKYKEKRRFGERKTDVGSFTTRTSMSKQEIWPDCREI